MKLTRLLFLAALTSLIFSDATALSQESPRLESDPFIISDAESRSKRATYMPPDTGCSLKTARAVGLRGFRLGMTLGEVRARVPGLKVRIVNPIGGKEAEVYWFNKRQISKLDFKGVESIVFVFLDDRLVEIMMMYDRSIKWASGEEMAKKVAEVLGLPSAWERDERERTQLGEVRRTVRCGNDIFLVGLVFDEGILIPVVTWYDMSTRPVVAKRAAEVMERRRRREERKKESFKP